MISESIVRWAEKAFEKTFGEETVRNRGQATQ